jgi:hypothetical protein
MVCNPFRPHSLLKFGTSKAFKLFKYFKDAVQMLNNKPKMQYLSQLCMALLNETYHCVRQPVFLSGHQGWYVKVENNFTIMCNMVPADDL